jgi:hypothetical protein
MTAMAKNDEGDRAAHAYRVAQPPVEPMEAFLKWEQAESNYHRAVWSRRWTPFFAIPGMLLGLAGFGALVWLGILSLKEPYYGTGTDIIDYVKAVGACLFVLGSSFYALRDSRDPVPDRPKRPEGLESPEEFRAMADEIRGRKRRKG